MLDLNDAERDYLTGTRALTVNAAGDEVLVGLTADETAFLMLRMRQFLRNERDHDRERRKRFLELRARHELARYAVIAAELEMRTESPTRH